ncbi:MAG: hypothetical protein EOP34_06765 [Rickettsiales bacterium]|nr:MAG: hypothetical protein EOP34_06765 [Rickettsiales bacterium]
MFIVGTTSGQKILQNLEIVSKFNFIEHIPCVEENEIACLLENIDFCKAAELCTIPKIKVPVKDLILYSEIASTSSEKIKSLSVIFDKLMSNNKN